MKKVRVLMVCNNIIILVCIFFFYSSFDVDSAEVLLYEPVSHNEVIKILDGSHNFDYSIESSILREGYTIHLISGNINKIISNELLTSDKSLRNNEVFVGRGLLDDWTHNPIGTKIETFFGTYEVKSIINSDRDIYILNQDNFDIDLQLRQKIVVTLSNADLGKINFLEFKENILLSNLPTKYIFYYRDILNTLIRLFSLSMIILILIEGYIGIKQNLVGFIRLFSENGINRNQMIKLIFKFMFLVIAVIVFRLLLKLYYESFIQYSFDASSFESVCTSLKFIKRLLEYSFNWGFSPVTLYIFMFTVYTILTIIIIISCLIYQYLNLIIKQKNQVNVD